MKKIIIIAALILCGSSAANADCYMLDYSIVHNWAEGACFDHKGNPYTLRMSYWDWVLDYGL